MDRNRIRVAVWCSLLFVGVLLSGCAELERATNAPLAEAAPEIRKLHAADSPEAKALAQSMPQKEGDSVTLEADNGATVTITLVEEAVEKIDAASLKQDDIQPQAVRFLLTETWGRSTWEGFETFATRLFNTSDSPAWLTTTITKTARGNITGGLNAYFIRLEVGFVFQVTRTFEVTARDVPPGGSVTVYTFPVGYYYQGQQRYADFGVSWYQCTSTTCSRPVGWTATRPTGVGFRLRRY